MTIKVLPYGQALAHAAFAGENGTLTGSRICPGESLRLRIVLKHTRTPRAGVRSEVVKNQQSTIIRETGHRARATAAHVGPYHYNSISDQLPRWYRCCAWKMSSCPRGSQGTSPPIDCQRPGRCWCAGLMMQRILSQILKIVEEMRQCQALRQLRSTLCLRRPRAERKKSRETPLG